MLYKQLLRRLSDRCQSKVQWVTCPGEWWGQALKQMGVRAQLRLSAL